MNVWVAPLDDVETAQAITKDTQRGIRNLYWAHTNEHVLYLQDKGGDENWHVYLTNVTTMETKDLTPSPKSISAQLYSSYRFPREILVGLNERDPRYHDLYQVNLDTGARTLVQEDPGFMAITVDNGLRVRAGERQTSDGGKEFLMPAKDGTWETFLKVGLDDSIATAAVGYDETKNRLYLSDSRGRNTSALTAIDLATGNQDVLAHDAQADVASFLVHPQSGTIQGVSFNYTREQWRILDRSLEKDFEYLRAAQEGDIAIVSRTLDDRLWVVSYNSDESPLLYYLYRRGAESSERSLQFLFANRPALLRQRLTQMRPVVISARDGLDLVSYVSFPRGSTSNGELKPSRPLPMVLWVHGGPWSRSRWRYDPIHQWLANRGYAVLDVNFRGSTGFGKEFVNAANREWGGKMQEDLLDAVDWAIEKGIADPERIAIFGGSYGGYATLVGLTFTPEKFACGIDLVGPSNLVTLLSSFPEYWEPIIQTFITRVGDHPTEEGRQFLLQHSPLTYAQNIRRPLLIAQGANDPRCTQAESDRIAEAVKQNGVEVTYLLYPDEGHGLVRPENWLSFCAAAEAFLARHLGGRCEPIGNACTGSSLQVMVDTSGLLGTREVPPETLR
jgi:dipeptidyl aminopeptidase/acylaminoacyl peptidase